MADILPPVVMSLIMGAAVLGVGLIPMPQIVKLIVQVAVGIAVYFGLALLTKNKELLQLLKLLHIRKERFE